MHAVDINCTSAMIQRRLKTYDDSCSFIAVKKIELIHTAVSSEPQK